jgi:hypothetical protein
MDFNLLQRVWEMLDRCWATFDELRKIEAQEFIQADELDQLIGRWQVCHIQHCALTEELTLELDIHIRISCVEPLH